MRKIPWWGLASAVIAPFALIGGWTAAADLQPGHFDAISQSISSLAAYGMTDRWVMTTALFVVSACNLVTGFALRPAALYGRALLVAGGVFGILVALNPQPIGGGSVRHEVAAGITCAAMTAWPLFARRPEPWAPAGLRPDVSLWATITISAIVVWYCAELISGAGMLGLAERVLTGAQTVWPLTVVFTAVLAGWGGRPVPERAVAAERSSRLRQTAVSAGPPGRVIAPNISLTSPGSNCSVASPTDSSIRCTDGSVVVRHAGGIQMPRSSASCLAAAA